MTRHLSLIAVTFLLLVMACAQRKAQMGIHLGAVDDLDSHAYDALLSAQAALDQAKASFKAGKLPQDSRGLINSAGSIYDATRSSWLIYRAIRSSGKDADGMVLVTNLRGLEAAIAEIFKHAGKQP